MKQKCPAHWGRSIKWAQVVTLPFLASRALAKDRVQPIAPLRYVDLLKASLNLQTEDTRQSVEYGGKRSGGIPEATAQEKTPSYETQKATGSRLSGFRTWQRLAPEPRERTKRRTPG